MIPKDLVLYTPQQIEMLAAQHLRQRVDVDFCPPINIEKLVQAAKNLDLQINPVLNHQSHVEGCVCKEFLSVNLTIVIDQRVYEGPWAKYSEALAEEYAHVCLHRSLFLEINSVDDFIELQGDPQWRRYEADAKRFSAALRMPPELLAAELPTVYARVVDEVGFGDVDLIETHLRNRLADIFRVTRRSMHERMKSAACNHRDQMRNSIQSRSLALLPKDWTVRPEPPAWQRDLSRDDSLP